MLPYLIVYPLLLLASLVWPALQSLRALHTKNQPEQKVWLFYWLGYAVVEMLFGIPFVEMILSIPLTLVIDVYYEAQLALVVALVNPKARQLDRVIGFVENEGGPYVEKMLTQLGKLHAEAVRRFPALKNLSVPASAPAAPAETVGKAAAE